MCHHYLHFFSFVKSIVVVSKELSLLSPSYLGRAFFYYCTNQEDGLFWLAAFLFPQSISCNHATFASCLHSCTSSSPRFLKIPKFSKSLRAKSPFSKVSKSLRSKSLFAKSQIIFWIFDFFFVKSHHHVIWRFIQQFAGISNKIFLQITS